MDRAVSRISSVDIEVVVPRTTSRTGAASPVTSQVTSTSNNQSATSYIFSRDCISCFRPRVHHHWLAGTSLYPPPSLSPHLTADTVCMSSLFRLRQLIPFLSSWASVFIYRASESWRVILMIWDLLDFCPSICQTLMLYRKACAHRQTYSTRLVRALFLFFFSQNGVTKFLR